MLPWQFTSACAFSFTAIPLVIIVSVLLYPKVEEEWAHSSDEEGGEARHVLHEVQSWLYGLSKVAHAAAQRMPLRSKRKEHGVAEVMGGPVGEVPFFGAELAYSPCLVTAARRCRRHGRRMQKHA